VIVRVVDGVKARVETIDQVLYDDGSRTVALFVWPSAFRRAHREGQGGSRGS
jgi:hypothetical protein